jgi:hypothetical protein
MSDTHQIDSGLGLMLDLICDTFGGVLFIAMLVIVMTNADAHQAALEPPSEEEQGLLTGSTEKMKANDARLDALRRALQRVQETEDRGGPQAIRDLADQVSQARLRWTNGTQEKNEALTDTGEIQGEINEKAQELDERAKDLARAQAALAEAERRLRDEQALRSRTARLPKIHVTDKLPAPFFLRGGRLVQIARRQRDGSLYNEFADCVKITVDGVTYVEPRPGRGFRVDSRGGADREIAARLSQFDPAQHYVHIFVWPDSYQEFLVLREVMVRMGFEYNLHLERSMDARIPVTESDSRGSRSYVQ